MPELQKDYYEIKTESTPCTFEEAKEHICRGGLVSNKTLYDARMLFNIVIPKSPYMLEVISQYDRDGWYKIRRYKEIKRVILKKQQLSVENALRSLSMDKIIYFPVAWDNNLTTCIFCEYGAMFIVNMRSDMLCPSPRSSAEMNAKMTTIGIVLSLLYENKGKIFTMKEVTKVEKEYLDA
jgi:hypothetical protein